MSRISFAQHIQRVLHCIEAVEQRLKVLACSSVSAQEFNFRFNLVRHFTQAHRSSQPGTALEGVQGAQHLHAGTQVFRPG